jgi:hypothetical protein
MPSFFKRTPFTRAGLDRWVSRTLAKARAARAFANVSGVRRWAIHRRLRQVFAGAEASRAGLHRFGRESDLHFTALASCLSRLNTRLHELRMRTEKLDHVLHDEDEDRALSSASELYRRSVDLVHASMGLALSEEEHMAEAEGRLLPDRDRFIKNSLQFRVLVLGLRTEAARLAPEEQSVFIHVAREIANMERRMTEITETAFAQIEAVVTEAGEGRKNLQRLQGGLQASAQRSIALIRDELHAIKRGLEPAAELSAEIGALLATARTRVARVITSLQAQDIVRQRLEHVALGFRDLNDPLVTGGEAPFEAIDLNFCHQAIRVQQEHLAASRKTIESAAEEVTSGMNALLETGDRLVQQFGHMETLASGVFSGSRLAELFRCETEQLVKIASESEQTNLRIAALVDRIEKAVQVFSEEISIQEIEVKLVALNAQIAAARMPDAGAMNKLAEETSRLSDDTAQLTVEMARELRRTLDYLHTIKKETDHSREVMAQERSELERGAAIVGEKLARLNQRIQLTSAESARDFQEVYKEAQALLPTLGFDELIEDCYAPSENFCATILALSAPLASATLSPSAAARLQAHRDRYTMAQERASHTRVVSSAAAVDAEKSLDSCIDLFTTTGCPDDSGKDGVEKSVVGTPATNDQQPAATDNYGDNVELF